MVAVATTFDVLAEPSRRDILDLLRERERSVGELFLGSGSAGGDAVCADSAQHSTERSSLDQPPWHSGVGFFRGAS